MSERLHTSSVMIIRQSTGRHKLTQLRRTHVTAQSVSADEGHSPGYRNATQKVEITAPTQGAFTLEYDGQETGNLDFDATAAEIQAALIALSNVGADDVSVTGANPWYVEFTGALGNSPRTLMVLNIGTVLNVDDEEPAFDVSTLVVGNLPGGYNPLVKGDDQPSNIRYESESVSPNSLPSEASIQRLTGTITVPTGPSTSEESTRKIWRGKTFSRAPQLSPIT
jgi:hypothetical protein